MSLRDGTEAKPASEFQAAEIADAFNLCFEEYVVPMRLSESALETMIARDAVDLTASRIFVSDGSVASLALVAFRDGKCRIAGFGVAPTHRGQGLGREAMEFVLSEIRDRYGGAVVLEVIEQNVPALALYHSLGFRETRRLAGYVLDDSGSKSVPDPTMSLIEIPASDFALKCRDEGETDLPWQITPAAFEHPSPVDRAFTLDGAYCLIGATTGETVALKGIAVDRSERRRGRGSALLTALKADFPGKRWSVAPLVPDDLAPEFFRRNGFVESDISQWEMGLDLG